MKHIISILLCFVTLSTFAQTDYNKWSMGLNIGSHDGMAPTSLNTRAWQPHHIRLNGRYMMNNRVGVMLDVSYDLFKFKNSDLKTNYVKTAIYGVVNAGDLLHFDTWTSRIGLLVYGGAGLSNMWQKDTLDLPKNDPLFKGVDDMLNFTFGARPQFKINERVSLNADLSFIFHAGQGVTFDMQSRSNHGAIDGYLINLSVGASYYFGKNKSHADWTPTVYGSAGDNTKYEAYESRIAELEEKLSDDDGDGVPNARDLEAGTEAEAIVDSKGRTLLDTDGDKIPDVADLCPNEAGLYSDNGCPDSDGDGVDDLKDKCPDVVGTHSNNGCPAIEAEVQKVMTEALKGVQFETGKAVLLKRSHDVLDNVAIVMKEHPEYYLAVHGHTDNVGTPELNLELSKKRAQTVTDFLISKGIDANRFHTDGFGETKPKVSNENEAGKAQNRRVEFNVVFE